jgi:hypothetical protein
VNWRGPFILHCECGWEKTYRNPIAAQWGGESHLPHCSFYQHACAVMRGEKKVEMARADYFSNPQVDWIKVEDVKSGQVLTIEMFEEMYFSGQGKKPAIRFKELPEQALILNQTNYDFFADLFGEDEFQWGGEKVIVRIEQVENPRKGQALQPGIRFVKFNPNVTAAAATATAKKK